MDCRGPQNATRFITRSASSPADDNRRQYNWRNAVEEDGLYDCRMSAIDTGDLESPWSNVVQVLKESEPSAPPAPTGLRARIPGEVVLRQSELFYAENTVETTISGVSEGSLVVAHFWHRDTPDQDPFVEGWNQAFNYSVYPDNNNDRRGTAFFWKEASGNDVDVVANWPDVREFHLLIEVYEGLSGWSLLDYQVADNGPDGGSRLTVSPASIESVSLAIASWGSRGLFSNVGEPDMDSFTYRSSGTGSDQYSMGIATGFVFNAASTKYTMFFSDSRAVAGLVLFGHGGD